MNGSRVGLIDNLSNIDEFLDSEFAYSSAAEVMTATGGNTGNVAFVFGTRKILDNSITRVGWGWTPEVVRKKCDHLVVCCANQIGKHADLGGWADKIEAFGLPVTLVGLGAQADDTSKTPEVPEGTKRLLKVVAEHRYGSAPNIAVRGEFTQTVLSEHGALSLAIGCPSLHISGETNLGATIFERSKNHHPKRVAVAAGNPWHGRSAFIEEDLVRIVESFHGSYVLQHPEAMLQFAFNETESLSETTIKRFREVYKTFKSDRHLLDWYRRYSVVFADAPNWIRFLYGHDIVLGPRYHGVALGVQAGIEGTVFAIDSRTAELSVTTGIKCLDVNDLKGKTADEIVDTSRWTQGECESFEENRRNKASQYVGFLTSNGLAPSPQLVRIADSNNS